MILKFKPFQKFALQRFSYLTVSSDRIIPVLCHLFTCIRWRYGQGAEYAGYSGTVRIAISDFLIIILSSGLRTKIGKRRTFFVAIGVSMFGYAIKWVCYNPDMPWLLLIPAPLISFGFASLFTLMPSMVADVVDEDELVSHERREGMYGSIFWWVVKLGQAVALGVGGFLLTATGFDVALEGNQSAQTISDSYFSTFSFRSSRQRLRFGLYQPTRSPRRGRTKCDASSRSGAAIQAPPEPRRCFGIRQNAS